MDYGEFLSEWRDGRDFVVCRTSGSTGVPKQIELPKEQMRRSARRTVEFFGLGAGSLLYSCVSPDFIGGKMMAVRSEELRCRLAWEKPSNRPLRGEVEGPVDLLAVVPSQMPDILDRLRDGGDRGMPLPEIRHVIIGGSPLNGELRRLIAESGLDAWETYGMTETASHIALRRVCAEEQPFHPLPGVRVRTDAESRLAIAVEGWTEFLTNDIADIYGDGGFRILGRHDNVIITGGKKVHPEQCEAVVEAALGAEVMFVGEPDLKWGERVTMLVDPQSLPHGPGGDTGDGAASAARILEICRGLLPAECVPKGIRFEPIPHTGNGKKLRKNANFVQNQADFII